MQVSVPDRSGGTQVSVLVNCQHLSTVNSEVFTRSTPDPVKNFYASHTKPATFVRINPNAPQGQPVPIRSESKPNRAPFARNKHILGARLCSCFSRVSFATPPCCCCCRGFQQDQRRDCRRQKMDWRDSDLSTAPCGAVS